MSSVTFEGIQFVVRCVLAAFFVVAGVTHFVPVVQRTMAAMIPPRLRFPGLLGPNGPRTIVVVTGLCEVAGGLGLLWPPTTVVAGACLVVFLVAVFPANVFAARDPERFGRAAIPIRTRVVEQLVLIALLVVAIV